MHDLVTYWPAQDGWTVTRLDAMQPTDIVIEVSHYMELPELPGVTISTLLLNSSGSVPDVFERTVSLGGLLRFQRHGEMVGMRPRESFGPAFHCYRRYMRPPSGDRQQELKEQKLYVHET